MSATYIHVPFCVHRCGYCDFTVITDRDDLISVYLDCLEQEIASSLTDPVEVETLFIGGGTPSYLPPSALERLFQILAKWFSVSPIGEFSIECNPEQFTTDRMQAMANAGVNRISLGVQSFNKDHLQTLERSHTPDRVADVVSRLRESGFDNVSIDLIYAVPGQTLEEWNDTLTAAIDLTPEHISTYGLTWEKGTTYWSRKLKNDLIPVPEERERNMYAACMERLPQHGYQQYELSNFAKPDHESRHNQMYWNALPFYGFGPGAAMYRDGIRSTNHRSVTTWINRTQNGTTAIADREQLDPEAMAREAVMLGLRQCHGINLSDFELRYGYSVRDLGEQAHDHFIESGELELVNGFIRLTTQGRFIADSIVVEFL